MARPRKKAGDKKQNVHLHLSMNPRIVAMAREADSGSQMFEQAAETCIGMFGLLEDAKAGKVSHEWALAKIEDRLERWSQIVKGSATFAAMVPPKKPQHAGRHAV